VTRILNRSLFLSLFLSVGVLSAQNDMRGHWSGTVDSQVGAVAIEVDLDKTANGWIGSVSIPAQGASGIPLDGITFADGKGAFHFKGGPQAPGFAGTLSNRTGEAKVELPKASAAVAAEFVGTWEGTINFGAPLRVVLTISNGKDGAEAQIVSLDQGNAQIPVSAITQKGTKLTLEVKAVGGGYEGEMNKESTQIDGTWTQVGMGTPLLLKKAAAPAK
jgi:hypothetical protein